MAAVLKGRTVYVDRRGVGYVLTGLALLPAIALVVWIYRQDKVEKEPRGLLWKIFLFGVLSVIPAMILEIILDEVFLVFVDADTLCYVILDNFIGVH